MKFDSFENNLNVAVIGATGGIGSAVVERLSQAEQIGCLYAFSRKAEESAGASSKIKNHYIDIADEGSVEKAAAFIEGPLHMVFVTTGFLHDEGRMPEKSMQQIEPDFFTKNMMINTLGPCLCLKHFLPRMHTDEKAVFIILSARVGSISDNNIGGWTSYRASKAAINMVIRNAAIEQGRKHKNQIIAGYQPGTVATNLSLPFQANVPDNKLFSTGEAANYLLGVVDKLRTDHSGCLIDWQGKVIHP